MMQHTRNICSKGSCDDSRTSILLPWVFDAFSIHTQAILQPNSRALSSCDVIGIPSTAAQGRPWPSACTRLCSRCEEGVRCVAWVSEHRQARIPSIVTGYAYNEDCASGSASRHGCEGVHAQMAQTPLNSHVRCSPRLVDFTLA
jgi:hypothetical protein